MNLKENMTTKNIASIAVILFMAFMIFALLTQGLPQNPRSYSSNSSGSSSQKSKFDETGYMLEGKNFVKQRLKDPKSADFRNVRFNWADVSGKKLPATCGEVNSKNGFGAYTGFQRFVSVPPLISAVESEVSDFAKLWASMCS